MDDSTIVTADDRQVRVITLNRPDRRNAFTLRLLSELNDALRTADADDTVRAVVVTGAGTAFCAGLDTTEDRDSFERDIDELDELRAWTLDTPVIAAINGAAIGVGLTLPIQWDLRVVAEDAPLSFAFSRLGLLPEAGAHWFLPRLVGAATAMDLLLTGRRFSGREAVSMGLASRAVPRKQVLDAAMTIAHDIADHVSPLSAALVKRLLWQFQGVSDPAWAVDRENEILGWLGNLPDAQEGISAMLERRKPSWVTSKHAVEPEPRVPRSPRR
ncbi:enoyl-CoA hydratase/isomerase family protein [Georgenia sp. SYP-B2076]|uniref:enoyl-CoA hydratase/isomerase family protein n=1 Tax=Georgenia sp. SYP-B2076 TaxID=2495881 RepID=UPI000F8F47AC|nr:enoyl-CoA hydratase-related protein [Georgenia sp. SYP-B2076]